MTDFTKFTRLLASSIALKYEMPSIYIKKSYSCGHYMQFVFQEQDPTSCRGRNPKLVLVFIKAYPFVKAFLDLINLICLLRYAFGYSKSHHLLFLSLGLRLTYASPSRAKFIQEKQSELFSPKSWRYITWNQLFKKLNKHCINSTNNYFQKLSPRKYYLW